MPTKKPPSKDKLLADAIDFATDEMWVLIEDPEIDFTKEFEGYTPAQRAAIYGRIEFLKKLKEKGVDVVSSKDDISFTPLQSIVIQILSESFDIEQFHDIICFLLENGASIDEIKELLEGSSSHDISVIDKVLEEAEKCFSSEKQMVVDDTLPTTLITDTSDLLLSSKADLLGLESSFSTGLLLY
ncbi:MAG: ankyrin repeat domain-containing protein [Rickettsiales bacterium]